MSHDLTILLGAVVLSVGAVAWASWLTIGFVALREWARSFSGYPRDADDLRSMLRAECERIIEERLGDAVDQQREEMRRLTAAIESVQVALARVESQLRLLPGGVPRQGPA